MKSHVYLLAHKSRPHFKIGKANDILHRARSFRIQELDLTRSVGFQLETEEEAIRLESILHRAFHRWRLKAEAIVQLGGTANGATEWFDESCRNDVERFLERNSEIFACTQISRIELRNSLRRASVDREAPRQRPTKEAIKAQLTESMKPLAARLYRELHRHLDGTVHAVLKDDHTLFVAISRDERAWEIELDQASIQHPDLLSSLAVVSTYCRTKTPAGGTLIGVSFAQFWRTDWLGGLLSEGFSDSIELLSGLPPLTEEILLPNLDGEGRKFFADFLNEHINLTSFWMNLLKPL